MGSVRYRRTQVLLEPEQHDKLEEIARQENRSLSEVLREMLAAQLAERKRKDMAEAAQALLADYVNDKDLTAFTALDAEEVR